MMNKFAILCILVLSSCSITSPQYLNLSEKSRKHYLVNNFDVKAINEKGGVAYSINSEDAKSFLSERNNSKKVIIFFTYWCSNSVQNIPKILDGLNSVQNADYYLITPEDWIEVNNYKTYSAYQLDSTNIFMLDVYEYGEKRSPHYRMKKFISEICDTCEEVGGFPNIIIYDENGSLIYSQKSDVEMDSVFRLLGNK